jgi:uncharacterized protein (TIGR02246 family)
MKTRLILVMVLALLLVPAVALHAQETDPEAVIMAYIDAVNAGDVEGALVYFAEDAVLAIVPFDTHTGIDEIRTYLENAVAVNAVLKYENLQVDGDTATMTVWYTDDELQTTGLTLEGTEEVVVIDGKIVTETWTATDETMAALQAAMEALPETGGGVLPLPAAVLALGGLLAGGGLVLKRRR